MHYQWLKLEFFFFVISEHLRKEKKEKSILTTNSGVK